MINKQAQKNYLQALFLFLQLLSERGSGVDAILKVYYNRCFESRRLHSTLINFIKILHQYYLRKNNLLSFILDGLSVPLTIHGLFKLRCLRKYD